MNHNVYSLKNKLFLLHTIAEGLIKIHEKHFVCLDLKSSNILISLGLWPKIIDYEGFCRCNTYNIV